MDGSGHHENGRHKQEQYKSLHSQWMVPPHLMKDHHAMTMKFMSILAERDAAIHERNLAVSEKKAALAERDMALMQREAAINERNNALMERDNAMAALEYRGSPAIDGKGAPTCKPGYGILRGMKYMHHPLHVLDRSHLNEDSYNSSRDMDVSDALPISIAASEAVKPRGAKRGKGVQAKKAGKASKTGKRGREEVPLERKNESRGGVGNGRDMKKQVEWKSEELVVGYEDSSIPVPGCSCTGVLQQCYKWGKGGWQSACCTTTVSMYPLPVMPNKRHARLGGRKMSGSAFVKLVSRLASEGHDLSTPLDLKDHWAKHGTNRYITIK